MGLFYLGTVLGWIAGIVTAALIAAVLAYFRKPLIQTMAHAETRLSSAGPGLKGHIFMPEPEADIARREHIAQNTERGKDTPITELM